MSQIASASDLLLILADHSSLRTEDGVIRVGQSRVPFDLVVEQYDNGMSPEDMVRAYDTLKLADVYAAIAYYLHHQSEVRTYMAGRAKEAADLRAKIEQERPRISRDELMSRRNSGEPANAPAGE